MNCCCRLCLRLSSWRGWNKVSLIPEQRIQPLKVAERSADLSYKLHTSPLSCTWSPLKMSGEKWQTVVSNKITVLIIHRFPTSSDSFPFKTPCSNGWHQAFVKVKVEHPTPDDTTDQFFHFFRSASLLLLSVQFQHLEAMCQRAQPQGMFEKSDWLMQGLCTDSWLPAFWLASPLVHLWYVLILASIKPGNWFSSIFLGQRMFFCNRTMQTQESNLVVWHQMLPKYSELQLLLFQRGIKYQLCSHLMPISIQTTIKKKKLQFVNCIECNWMELVIK